MTHPVLCTQRLILRPLVAEDAEALTTLIDDYEVAKWLTVVPHPYTHADAEWFIADQAKNDGHVWAITKEDTLMGVIGDVRELGYWLGRPYWGHGYMKEAARAVTTHWYDTHASDPLISGHFLGNAGSRSVLQSLGFTDTHIEPAHSKAQDKEVQLQRMRLTRAAWEAKHG